MDKKNEDLNEQQKPAAWQDTVLHTEIVSAEDWENIDPMWHWMYRPLYESPPAQRLWVGLTKEEVDSWELPDSPTVFEFVQFIEAKIKDKNI